MTPPRRTVAAATALLLAASAALAAPAGAASPGSTPAQVRTTNRAQAAAGWLATQFAGQANLPAPDGDHFGASFGGTYFPDYGENADVIFGLAAAKAGRAKSRVALGYLAAHVRAYADLSGSQGGPFDGSLGKDALAAIVADVPGTSPTSFGGVNLMARLAADECPARSTTCTPGAAKNIFASVSESLIITAQARTGGRYAPSSSAVSYFLSLQCRNGGFTAGTKACRSGPADVDATAYALMALQALGGQPNATSTAIAWLSSQRRAGRYWVSQGGPNVDSTGLAVAALRPHGVDVSAAQAWLRTQQVPAGRDGAGALRYLGRFTATTSTAATSPDVLGTAQGLLGLVRGGSYATLTAAGSANGTEVFAPSATVASTAVRAGGTQRVVAHGFAAGESVTASVHSRSITVGRVRADGSGTVRLSFTTPARLAAGRHHVVLTGAASNLRASAAFTVRAAPAPTPQPTPASHSGGLANTGLDGRALAQLAGYAMLAVVMGVALVVAGRRRRPA
jgi:hypothetical protein